MPFLTSKAPSKRQTGSSSYYNSRSLELVVSLAATLSFVAEKKRSGPTRAFDGRVQLEAAQSLKNPQLPPTSARLQTRFSRTPHPHPFSLRGQDSRPINRCLAHPSFPTWGRDSKQRFRLHPLFLAPALARPTAAEGRCPRLSAHDFPRPPTATRCFVSFGIPCLIPRAPRPPSFNPIPLVPMFYISRAPRPPSHAPIFLRCFSRDPRTRTTHPARDSFPASTPDAGLQTPHASLRSRPGVCFRASSRSLRIASCLGLPRPLKRTARSRPSCRQSMRAVEPGRLPSFSQRGVVLSRGSPENQK